VLVVSACYSGSFIDTLKDDHTLIITAAAANRKEKATRRAAPMT
jgi:Peptidase C13 family